MKSMRFSKDKALMVLFTISFVILMVFNVTLSSRSSVVGDTNLLGLEVSASVPRALADYYWKISYWQDPVNCPGGYMARCGLDGSECDQVVNPTCFQY